MSNVDKQTTIYLHWEVKSALLDVALDKQRDRRRKVTPNEAIAEMIRELHPDIAAKNGLAEEDATEVAPESLASARAVAVGD